MKDLIIKATIRIKNIFPILIVTILLLYNFSCSLFSDEDEHFQNYDNLRDITHWTVDTLDYPGVGNLILKKFWGSSPDDLYLVGSSSEGLIGAVWHYDGNEWTPVPLHSQQGGFIPGFIWVKDIWGFSKDNIYIVGVDWTQDENYNPIDSSFVVHYNGDEWSKIDVRSTGLVSIGGTGPNDIWLGGFQRGNLVHYNGKNWTHHKPPLTQEFYTHGIPGFPIITKSNSNITYAIAENYFDQDAYLISTSDTNWNIDESYPLQDYHDLFLLDNGSLFTWGFSDPFLSKWNNGQWQVLEEELYYFDVFLLNEDNLLIVGSELDDSEYKRKFYHYNSIDKFHFNELDQILYKTFSVYIWSKDEEIFIASIKAIVDPNHIEPTVHKTVIIHGR